MAYRNACGGQKRKHCALGYASYQTPAQPMKKSPSKWHRRTKNVQNQENQDPMKHKSKVTYAQSTKVTKSSKDASTCCQDHGQTQKVLQSNKEHNQPYLPQKSSTDAIDCLHQLFQTDDQRKIPYRPEVFHVHSIDARIGRMDESKFHSIKGRICKQWNPLFQSGCRSRNCSHQHLYENVFLRFVKHVHLKNNKTLDIQSAVTSFERALTTFHQKSCHKALQQLITLTKSHIYNGVLNFWIARCYHTLNQMHHADLHYRRALAIQPDNGTFHAFYAQFSVDFGRMEYPNQKGRVHCSQYKQAKQHFKKALNIHNCSGIHFCFAKFLDEVECQYPNAAFHYRNAIEGNSGDHRMRLNYARLLHKMGKLRNAHTQYTTLMEHLNAANMYLSSLWPHFHFARLLVDIGECNVAREQFMVCLDIMDQHQNRYFAEIFYEFAKLLHYKFGEHDQAMQYINTALNEAPERRIYRKLYYRIKHSQERAQRSRNTEQRTVYLNQKHEMKDQYEGSCSLYAHNTGNNVQRDYQPQAMHPQHHYPPNNQQVHDHRGVHGVCGSMQTQSTSPVMPQQMVPNVQRQDIDTKPVTVPTAKVSNNGDLDRVIRGVHNMSFGSLPFQKRNQGHDRLSDGNERKEPSIEPHDEQQQQQYHDQEMVMEPHSKKKGLPDPKEEEEEEEEELEEEKEERVSDWTRFLSDDDGFSFDTEDDEECADVLCQTEFDRFMSSDDNPFDEQFETFYDRFEDDKVNDIRNLVTEKMSDDTYLRETIQMDDESIAVWKESVFRFNQEHVRYVEWLKKIGFYEAYYVKLEGYGIMTLDAFCFHNRRSVDDLVAIIGSDHKKDADAMWKSAQVEMELNH